jgi:thiamine biosynthesis lipoprotein
VEVPAELVAILKRAQGYSAESGGAFDVTWRGMGRLWRFDDAFRVPDPGEVEQARRRVDYRQLEIRGNLVRLAQRGMAIGLGGIAKGYAVDRASEVLSRAGFPNHLVAGAGDIRVGGTRGGRPWSLGVQDPRRERGTILGRVLLSGGAISTSGDYERFRIQNGVRYHHLIDPRTGYPAAKSMAVTVLAPSSEQADALATAIFVLGPAEGLELARRAGVDALVIDPAGKWHPTDGFRRRFETEP